MLILDSLARRYAKLPSEILINSNTLDLYVMDVALTVERYQNKKADNNGVEPIPEYTTSELLEILNRNKS